MIIVRVGAYAHYSAAELTLVVVTFAAYTDSLAAQITFVIIAVIFAFREGF